MENGGRSVEVRNTFKEETHFLTPLEHFYPLPQPGAGKIYPAAWVKKVRGLRGFHGSKWVL